MTEREAGVFLEEIEENICHTLECRETSHEDEMSERKKMQRLTAMPSKTLESWDLLETVSKSNLFDTKPPETAKME